MKCSISGNSLSWKFKMLQSYVVVCFGVAFLLFGVNKAVAFTTGGRIIDGEYTTIEEFPYQAYISHHNRTHCGGSIINKFTILTAAHCIVLANVEKLAIRVGVTDVTKSGGVTRHVAKPIIHEHYNEHTVVNDIAILILDQPLDYTDSIQPIRLPNPGEEVPAHTKAFVSGWGLVGENKSTSPILKYAKVSVVDKKKCAEEYPKPDVRSTMMCAGRSPGTGRPCNSDSGGPLAIFDSNGEPLIVGLVSFSTGCSSEKPDVYTQISSYIDWIKDHMQ